MIMEIIVGVIALAFVILVIFLILTLQDARKTIKEMDKVLIDIHKKLDTFSWLSSRKGDEKKSGSKLTPAMECIADAIRLFQKIKNEIIT